MQHKINLCQLSQCDVYIESLSCQNSVELVVNICFETVAHIRPIAMLKNVKVLLNVFVNTP